MVEDDQSNGAGTAKTATRELEVFLELSVRNWPKSPVPVPLSRTLFRDQRCAARSENVYSTNTRWLKKLAALVMNEPQRGRLIVYSFPH
jgi:hypothetical protein